MRKYRRKAGAFREKAGDEIQGTSIYEPLDASVNSLSKEIYERMKVLFL